MTYMVLLALFLVTTSSTTPEERNEYCWRERKADSWDELISRIYCKNMDVQRGDFLRIKNQTLVDEDIRYVNFISIAGHIDETALNLFPNVTRVNVIRNKLAGIALKSIIQDLVIINSCFPKVTRESLKGVTEIQNLGFMGNPGLEFETGAFKDLKIMKRLAIINQNISRLQRNFLEGLEHLNVLRLSYINLTEIDDDAFADHVKLIIINLDDNPLESFKANISKLTELKQLSLFNTNLKQITFDLFASSLHSLNLPTDVLLHNFNITMIKTSFPNLKSISISMEDLQNPEIKPVEEMLSRDGLELNGYYLPTLDNGDNWREKEFYGRSVIC